MYITISLFILTQACASCININIHGPHYVRNGEHIWVNCSSDIVPSGQYTEFIVNGETLDSLERQATGCFSAIKRARCSSNMCHCSQDAKQYAVRVHVNQEFQNLTVECSMKFKSKEPLFAKRAITIRVLDLSGPKIDINGAEIIVAGTKRIIRCNVITTLVLQMYWKCLTITSSPPKRYSFTLSIFAHINAKSSDHGEICTCIVQYENFVTSASIMLNISSPPIIQVSNTAICNRTADAQLQCYLSGDLHYYGFGQWIHTINGKYIRKLNGTTHGNISTLVLQSCSYEDFGNYTCIAWNENNHHKYWSNKTTILTVRDLPVIADTDIVTEPELQLGLLYYSIPTPVNIQWFRYGEKLENLTSYSFSSIKQSMNLQFHGINILCDGYRSSLRIAKPLYGEYIAVLKNEIGETEHEFNWESDKIAFGLHELMWGLTGVVIFIATAGIMGIFMKIRTSRGIENITDFHSSTKPAAIYYAAPEEENNVHLYNDTEHGFNQSINSSVGQYEEIPDNYQDINRLEVYERRYDVSHHYNEIDT
ncbi:HMCN [Mytilus coruscus]|uniref:HMCN n=1 Tax=Mytilus coruscus TaxID=42192 RepID=A0A6J8BYF9_MYTCO|nr:HMCN [Mytilus coruscus]